MTTTTTIQAQYIHVEREGVCDLQIPVIVLPSKIHYPCDRRSQNLMSFSAPILHLRESRFGFQRILLTVQGQYRCMSAVLVRTLLAHPSHAKHSYSQLYQYRTQAS
jgi:hypothetical protein